MNNDGSPNMQQTNTAPHIVPSGAQPTGPGILPIPRLPIASMGGPGPMRSIGRGRFNICVQNNVYTLLCSSN